MTDTQPRNSAGSPAGGQFGAKPAGAESVATLDSLPEAVDARSAITRVLDAVWEDHNFDRDGLITSLDYAAALVAAGCRLGPSPSTDLISASTGGDAQRSEAGARAVDAVERVLALHDREVIAVHEGHGEEAWCPECRVHWPCPTAKAVEGAR